MSLKDNEEFSHSDLHNEKLNENMLKNLKEKKDNPFWIPNHSVEIFEMRDIIRQERDIKKTINRAKFKQRDVDKNSNKTNNFSKTENLLNNDKNIYITEHEPSENYKNFIEKFEKLKNLNAMNTNKINSDDNNKVDSSDINAKLLQDIILEKKANVEPVESSESLKQNKIQKKIESIAGKKKKSVRNFLEKTREIILTKYSINIKKERAIRIQETYNNEIESIKDSIFAMQEARTLFQNEFIMKFEEYVKHLIMQREKEKAEENNLLENKIKLDSENKNLKNKISKLQEKQIQYEDYRDFMIQVKESMLVIPDFYKPDRILYENTEDLPAQTKHSQGQGQPATHAEKTKRIRSYYSDETIFSSVQELIDELKKLELNNISLLDEYNEGNLNLVESNKELTRMIEEDEALTSHFTTELSQKENELKEIKDRHRRLSDTRNILHLDSIDRPKLDRRKIKTYSTISKYLEPQLYAKVVEVYKSCNELDIYLDKDLVNLNTNTLGNLQSNSNLPQKKENNNTTQMLVMLSEIEKNLVNLLAEYDQFKLIYDSRLNKIEKKLEEDRKEKKNQEIKIEYKLLMQTKRIEIEGRNNKIFIKSKRKKHYRCPPTDEYEKEKLRNQKIKLESTFEDFISF